MASEKWLLFVDTNVFLDFYRLAGPSAVHQLKSLERIKDSLILSEQVRMEFLKNRQKVIIAGCIRDLKMPGKPNVPSLLGDDQIAKDMIKHLENAEKKYKALKQKIDKVLNEPARHDNVYNDVMSLFAHDGPLNLRKGSPQQNEIHSLARQRSFLGYPPRKDRDSSVGDAINWEWIVRCALSSTDDHHICIVSRDGDYGVGHANTSILNDWLRTEFEERLGKKRKVRLQALLTEALKPFGQMVPAQYEDEEKMLLKSGRDWHRSLRAAQTVVRRRGQASTTISDILLDRESWETHLPHYD